jgi:hypothetical protein
VAETGLQDALAGAADAIVAQPDLRDVSDERRSRQGFGPLIADLVILQVQRRQSFRQGCLHQCDETIILQMILAKIKVAKEAPVSGS